MDNFCDLAYGCSLKIPQNTNLLKPREQYNSWYEYEDNFYVEKYNQIEYLIDRIKYIYSLDIQYYKEKNVDIYPENVYTGNCAFRQLFVSNKMDEYMLVGLNPYGWNLSISIYSYLCKYFEKHYGKDNTLEMFNLKADIRQVWLYATAKSEPYIVPAYESVSEETATIILKNFFAGLDPWHTPPEVIYREIEKRNYLK